MSIASESSLVGPGFEISRILEEQRRLDEKRRVKRAANRKSASTSRARKKAYVDEMTASNERMKQHALVLSMLPDLLLAVCRSGEMTYVSPSSQWLLLHSPEEVIGANIFELVTHDCHPLLRNMISEHLSRPVQTQLTARVPSKESDGSEASDDDAGNSDAEGPSRESSTSCGQLGNHRERFQAARNAGISGKDIRRSGSARVTTHAPPRGRKMLRLIRCDKTTVWCESRLSVRCTKAEGAAHPAPLEIILTLRPVSEGSKTSTALGIAGVRVPNFDHATPESVVDANDYVGADDEGYQCEVEEEDSNNSGSGNDSNVSSRKRHAEGSGGSSSSGSDVKQRSPIKSESAEACSSMDMDKREERSYTKKRPRNPDSVSDRLQGVSAVATFGSNKPGCEDSSTGGDTADMTAAEGSGSSCSNGADSNGEGSNNGSSKWGDGSGGGSRCGEFGGSEDGSLDGNSGTGTDLGEEVQSAVQSLILMGGFSEGAQ